MKKNVVICNRWALLYGARLSENGMTKVCWSQDDIEYVQRLIVECRSRAVYVEPRRDECVGEWVRVWGTAEEPRRAWLLLTSPKHPDVQYALALRAYNLYNDLILV